MRILISHDYYQQSGGEDRSFEGEAALLQERGHEIVRFTMHNDDINRMSRCRLVRSTFWNSEVYNRLAALVRSHRIEVAHFHNTFPLISPSAYAAARSGGAAVVQTLHNFRLLCLNALLYRNGNICEQCLTRAVKLPGVLRRCYRQSLPGSGVVAMLLAVHQSLGTWNRAIDSYVAPSTFARRMLIRGGMPQEKIDVVPNSLPFDPGAGSGAGGYAVFVGRLSQEKGLGTLLAAWRGHSRLPPLKIIGDGPLAPVVRNACTAGRIEWLGRRAADEVYRIMGNAAAVIFPSECYETFGRVAVEAFAVGTPVIASDRGAMAELIAHGRTGRLFRTGDPDHLAAQFQDLLTDGRALAQMRAECRQEFLRHYTADRNHEKLIAVYRRAIAARTGGGA